MTTVRLEIELDGDYEDLADILDEKVCEALHTIGIYPSSVITDEIEGGF